jgi:signal transduction histidine kinase/FixJ family two-component response regulator
MFFSYIALIYCLSFYASMMTFLHHGAYFWLANDLIAIMLMFLLLDFVTLVFVLFTGMALAAIFCIWTLPHAFAFLPGRISITEMLVLFIWVFFMGSILILHRKMRMQMHRRVTQMERAASNAKTEFIANMSHDLRTPMSGLVGVLDSMDAMLNQLKVTLEYSDQVSKEKLLSQMQHSIDALLAPLDVARGATHELLQLFSEILETIRLESGKIEHVLEHFNLEKVIEKNIALLQPIAEHHNLLLQAQVSDDVPEFFYGVRRSLDRILINIISNALKFTKEGEVTIDVSMKQEGPIAVGDAVHIIIRIIDTGIGIPEDKYEEIFNHFARLTASYKGVYKGSGLGLYAVKRYVESMDGDISVSSVLGKGSVFELVIPLIVSDYSDQEESIAKPAAIMPLATSSLEPSAVENPIANVLIAEDNVTAAMGLKMLLHRLNCHVDYAKTGEEAVSLAANNDYDLIIMDIGLPGMSGLEATAAIRDSVNPKRADVPIVALTAHEDQRSMCIEAGMQDMMQKPAQLLMLENMLHRYVLPHITETVQPENADKDIMDWDACLALFPFSGKAVNSFVQLCVGELQGSEVVLAEALEERDIATLRAECHKMRGGISYFKLPEVERTLHEFHTQLKTDPQNFELIHQAYDAYIAALKRFYALCERKSLLEPVGE